MAAKTRKAIEPTAAGEAPAPPSVTPADLAGALSTLAQALAARTPATPSDQPAVTNLELAVMCQELELTAMALSHYFVHQARTHDNVTWETVGQAFGTSRQSAYTRFGRGDAIDARFKAHRPS